MKGKFIGKILVGVGAVCAALFSIGEAKDAFSDAKQMRDNGIDGIPEEELNDVVEMSPQNESTDEEDEA